MVEESILFLIKPQKLKVRFLLNFFNSRQFQKYNGLCKSAALFRYQNFTSVFGEKALLNYPTRKCTTVSLLKTIVPSFIF